MIAQVLECKPYVIDAQSPMTHPKVVTAAISIRSDSVLLARRSEGQSLAGYWEFPGGKVEPGESLQDCLSRELMEELGVVASVGDVFAESLYQYAHGSIKLVGLHAELASAEFKLSVHDSAEWVPIDQLLSFQLAPADIPIAKKVVDTYGV